MLGRSN